MRRGVNQPGLGLRDNSLGMSLNQGNGKASGPSFLNNSDNHQALAYDQ